MGELVVDLCVKGKGKGMGGRYGYYGELSFGMRSY